MQGIHVNGFNIISSTSSTSQSTTTRTSTSLSTTSTTTLSPTNTVSASSGLSTGAAVGIGIAAATLLIFTTLATFLLFRRRRKTKAGAAVTVNESKAGYVGVAEMLELHGTSDAWDVTPPQEAHGNYTAYEMESSTFLGSGEVNELPVGERRHEMGS